jgi:hypothetical protein
MPLPTCEPLAALERREDCFCRQLIDGAGRVGGEFILINFEAVKKRWTLNNAPGSR